MSREGSVRGAFITGTDTGCGKTEVTLGLMKNLQTASYRVLGMKPVASGAEFTLSGLRNEDALRIQQQGSSLIKYDAVNPFAFEPAIAPHLAAMRADRTISLPTIAAAYAELAKQADWVVVEGVGGWLVPLCAKYGVDDLARELGLPVILVVGIRLGCINHALLTANAIRVSGCRLTGWVANCTDPEMAASKDNIETLKRRIPAPLLGVVPWMSPPVPQAVAERLDLSLLPPESLP